MFSQLPHSLHKLLKMLMPRLSFNPRTQTELIACLQKLNTEEILDSKSLEMIEGVLKLAELRVRDIMVARSQMTCIKVGDSLKAVLEIVAKTIHSRFPVFNDTKDEIVGILLAKDLLAFESLQNTKPFKTLDILRPPLFVPESKRLDVLLQEFRLNRNHMAIVVNEYGSVTGLVTIEDVLEEIVGDIEDEYDLDCSHHIKKLKKGVFAVSALTSIEQFNKFFHTKLQDNEVETMGGLILRQLEHVPKRGELVQLGPHKFTVMRADSRRIHWLQLQHETKEHP